MVSKRYATTDNPVVAVDRFVCINMSKNTRDLFEISGAKILNNLPYLQVIQQVIQRVTI